MQRGEIAAQHPLRKLQKNKPPDWEKSIPKKLIYKRLERNNEERI